MNEPQVWTLIGVFAAALVGIIGLFSTMFARLIRAEVGGLRNEMIARFDKVDARLDHLDRDAQAVVAKVFPEA